MPFFKIHLLFVRDGESVVRPQKVRPLQAALSLALDLYFWKRKKTLLPLTIKTLSQLTTDSGASVGSEDVHPSPDLLCVKTGVGIKVSREREREREREKERKS